MKSRANPVANPGGRRRLKQRVWLAIGAIGLVFGLGAGLGMWLGGEGPSSVSNMPSGGRAEVATIVVRQPARAPQKPPPPLKPVAKAIEEKPASAPSPVKSAPEPNIKVAAAPPSSPSSQKAAVQPVWLRNAVSVPPSDGRPMIAIVIDDMGLDRRRSRRAVGLPGPLTMAYLAYAEELAEQASAARAVGHEIILHLPMEPSVSADPGPNVLLATAGAEKIRTGVSNALARFSGFVGVNNHMGSRFTATEQAMRPMLAELKARGLLFLDSLTTSRSVARRLGRELEMPVVSRDVFLDDEATEREVTYRLAQAERIAKKHGTAIAIGHPKDATIKVLSRWLPEAPARGFALVPLSAIAKHRLPTKLRQAMVLPSTAQ